MAKKKAKVVQLQTEPTEEIRVDDLYTAFKVAYDDLKHARYALFLKAKELFLAKEWEKSKKCFEILKDNIFKHTKDKPTPALAVRQIEYIADHLKPLKYKTANSSAQQNHVTYMKNQIETLDRLIYPG